MKTSFFGLLLCCVTVFVVGCASVSDRSSALDSSSGQMEGYAGEEGWQLQQNSEPLPSMADPAPQEERLTSEDFDLAQPSEPRNPFDSWEYRQYRRIVPPAQR